MRQQGSTQGGGGRHQGKKVVVFARDTGQGRRLAVFVGAKYTGEDAEEESRSSGTSTVFKALATAEPPLPRVFIRRGDIQDSGARTDEERHQIATTPTIIACLLAYLKNVTVGPDGTGPPGVGARRRNNRQQPA
jgi:hypothetical protein